MSQLSNLEFEEKTPKFRRLLSPASLQMPEIQQKTPNGLDSVEKSEIKRELGGETFELKASLLIWALGGEGEFWP